MDAGLHAERALLGAVLTDPGGQQHVLGFVQPDDFYRSWHGQVLAAMQRLRARGVLAGPEQVYAELRRDPELPRSVSLDAVPLADLLAAASRSSHAQAYAGIVISASLRRWIGVCGGRLRQAGQVAGGAPVDDRELEGARLVVSRARTDVEASRLRWTSLPAAIRRELPVTGRLDTAQAEVARRAGLVRDELTRLREDMWARDSSRLAGQLAAITQGVADIAAASARQDEPYAARLARHEARPVGEAAEKAGLAVLRDLAAAPARIGEVAGWLQPQHFARPEHGEVYAVLTELHRARMPVDPVMVSWEASRRGIEIHPQEMAGGCGAFAPASAAQVYRRAALARVERAGLDIQAAAADTALPVGATTEAAGKLLAQLEADLDPQRCSVPRAAEVIALRSGKAASRSGGRPDARPAREAVR